MKIGIATDHNGIKKKKKLIKYLEKKGHQVINYGPNNNNSVDYPDFAFNLSKRVSSKEIDIGILICGTGIGMCIASNKINGVRCAKVDNNKEAYLARNHNDANVISLSNDLRLFKMKDIIDIFLKTSFSTEERHKRRIDKINNYHNINEY